MLRSEHSIVRYDFQRKLVVPDRLIRGRDKDYLPAARTMLRLYRTGSGRTRQALHREVEQHLSRLPGCPPRRFAAFCKLLDDRATYQHDKRAAVELRQKVFSLAAPMHPIVEQQEGIFDQTVEMTRRKISQSLGMSWQEIDARLFSDVVELQTLTSFDDSIEPAELLSVYNVSQTQAALYRASGVRIEALADFKTIVRHIKLAGLMHRIAPLDGDRPGYRFQLDGPQSSLRETTRYGVRFAAMLPKLLACRRWRMSANIIGPRRKNFRMRLSSEDGLTTKLESPDPFDSKLEQEIEQAWNESPVAGWTMQRESELLHQGQSVLTPDFVLQQTSTARRIYIEVVGFWTPEYLTKKSRRLADFIDREQEWLLIFPKQQATARETMATQLSVPTIEFDARADPACWIDAMKPLGQHSQQR
jgi:predicted nuclease of restriction endonuclease-like RecB superfamily